MTVGLVIVSHSARIAEGVVELAAQMAAAVEIVPAGDLSLQAVAAVATGLDPSKAMFRDLPRQIARASTQAFTGKK